jgi:hypothetical protein
MMGQPSLNVMGTMGANLSSKPECKRSKNKPESNSIETSSSIALSSETNSKNRLKTNLNSRNKLMATEPKDRWHPPMTTDVKKLEDFGTPDLPMGDYPGDYPPPRQRAEDEVGVQTLEEVLEYYEQSQPHPLNLRDPQDPNA